MRPNSFTLSAVHSSPIRSFTQTRSFLDDMYSHARTSVFRMPVRLGRAPAATSRNPHCTNADCIESAWATPISQPRQRRAVLRDLHHLGPGHLERRLLILGFGVGVDDGIQLPRMDVRGVVGDGGPVAHTGTHRASLSHARVRLAAECWMVWQCKIFSPLELSEECCGVHCLLVDPAHGRVWWCAW